MRKLTAILASRFFFGMLFIEILLFSVLYITLVTSRVDEAVNALLVQGNNHSNVLENYFSKETLYHVALMESKSDTGVAITSPNKKDIYVQSENISEDMLNHIAKSFPSIPKKGLVMEDHWRTQNYICTVSPVIINGHIKAYVFMFQDTTYIRAMVDKITLTFFVSFILTIIATGISIWFISRKLTNPILRMKETTLHLARGSYETKLHYSNPKDELEELANSITYLGNELTELKKNRSEFLASISHELRTPLTFIKGYIKILQKEDIETSVRAKYIRIIDKETERLTKLIEDLFLYARLDYNEFDIHLEKMNLVPFIESIVEKSQWICKENSICISFAPTQSDLYINADRERMEQVFFNIIQNSVKHSNKGDKITISAYKKNHSIVIAFQDEGMGIDQEEIPYLFFPFYRVDTSRHRHTGGTGLGLSIVKQIIDKHNGSIQIESKKDEGTTVLLSLPKIEK